ncbi:MAG: GNAT family N-acetyltransferase [Phyllobacterium sp.]
MTSFSSIEIDFIALLEGKLAGCAFLAEKENHFYLGKLAVSPEAHGRNIGRALLTQVENHAVTRGKPVLELQTRIELISNHRIFKRFDFQKTQETAHPDYDGPTSITMRKALPHGT